MAVAAGLVSQGTREKRLADARGTRQQAGRVAAQRPFAKPGATRLTHRVRLVTSTSCSRIFARADVGAVDRALLSLLQPGDGGSSWPRPRPAPLPTDCAQGCGRHSARVVWSVRRNRRNGEVGGVAAPRTRAHSSHRTAAPGRSNLLPYVRLVGAADRSRRWWARFAWCATQRTSRMDAQCARAKGSVSSCDIG